MKNYSVLFVTDSHIRSVCLNPLVDWVKNGGTQREASLKLESDVLSVKLDVKAGCYILLPERK
ncbi:MAG: hypothetical protein FWE67_12345 [Planctomycetaceae bacterium]|nr:hypothetical protein [Planctomycetaceae bacterium]